MMAVSKNSRLNSASCCSCSEDAVPYAAVIGGANIDIAGIASAALIPGDSNPGVVRFSPGGVARNIAENLARLGVPVRFITAFGDDPYAGLIKTGCLQAGIDISAAKICTDYTTSVYLSLHDPGGEMQLAVSDMRLYDMLTPEYLATQLALINYAAVCIADTNIPQESLAFLAEHCTVPLFIDPVSVTKAAKIRDLLPFIHTIKPNRLEAEFLTGISLSDESGSDGDESVDESMHLIADVFLQRGVRQLFLSLGSRGIFCADASRRFVLPPEQLQPVNMTGAGDGLFAGLVWGFMYGLDLEHCARAGRAAAGISIESPDTVSRAMSAELLCRRAGISLSGQTDRTIVSISAE